MRYKQCLLLCIGMISHAYAQNIVVKVLDKHTNSPIADVAVGVVNTTFGSVTNQDGIASFAVGTNSSSFVIRCSSIGYNTITDTIRKVLTNTDTLLYVMEEAEGEEMEEVSITSTRSSRSIADIPTRVECIAGEELDEKANMKPGDIRMMLAESTGIQTQQTSATTANASIRIQGMDGRYTQLLKDGFPLYSGAASGLGLLQIPPLDLKQVEVIKGSSSTLYGGGAIAGMVNLISKTPGTERELRFLLNGTGAGGVDVSGFWSQRRKKVGGTLLASHNSNQAYDPSGIGFSAIPLFQRITINPKFFYYPTERTTLQVGVNSSIEDRLGGSMRKIKGEAGADNDYYEKNITQRLSTQLVLKHQLNEKMYLQLKNSYGYFNRALTMQQYEFKGHQDQTFTELSVSHSNGKHDATMGLNLWTDKFTEHNATLINRGYEQITTGAFVQDVVTLSEHLSAEAGLRFDHVANYGNSLLPRVALLYKFNTKLSSRIGGGMGYKSPTVFTEESERIQYRNVQPISVERNKLERSYGVNWDVNYRLALWDAKVVVTINQLIYYTRLDNPLLLQPNAAGQYWFNNIDGHIDSKGGETNIKVSYGDFKWYIGYTYTDAKVHVGNVLTTQPLTPLNRLNNVLMYEVEDKLKIGLEAYYFAPQQLSDNTTGRDYWIMGFMAEKLWHKMSVYVNFENFLDSRQTRFSNIYTGTQLQPTFRDIYAPLDGFVVNAGIKIRL